MALRALPAALFTLLLVLVWADPLFTRRNFVGRDLVLYGLPLEKEVHDAWAAGRVPVWSEDVSGGRPLFPNPNAGPLYPVRPLLSRLPFPAAMRLFPVVHWAIAGVGMLVLLRALAVSGAGAWVGAVTFAFSGVVVSEVFYLPIMPAAVLHPWVLWTVARRAGSFGRKAVPIGIAWGLMLLVGDVVALGIAFLAALLWIALEADRASRGRELAALVAGLGLGLLLAAPQVAATALLVPETRRAVMGIPVKEALRFTLSPWRLLELVVPYPFGELWTLEDRSAWGSAVFRGFFVTLYCGAFAVVALSVLRRSREPGARFARVLFWASLLLGMSGVLVPSSLGDRPFPVPLRSPEKFSVAVVFALAVAAGLAFDRLRRGGARPAWMLRALVLFAAAALAATVFPEAAGKAAVSAVGASSGLAGLASRQLPAALAEAGLLWAATLVAMGLAPGGGARLFASVLLLTAVPIAATRRIGRTENEASVLPPTAFARTVARADPRKDYRTVDGASYHPPSPLTLSAMAADPCLTESERRSWSYMTQALWGRGTVFNLDPDRGDLSRLESLRRASVLMTGQEQGGVFFATLGLKFGIRYRDQPSLPGYRRFGGDAYQDWDENPDARPAVRLLERWREMPGALAALAALPHLSPGEVVLETGRSAAGASRPGTLRVLEKLPERLVVETSSPDPTVLFAVRGYWAHRTIRVDGVEVECVPAHLAFSAVPVPAGTHRVEWIERIPGLEASLWGPALFALLAAALLARRRPALCGF